MEGGKLVSTATGVPQGGPISVLISNVYLHYTLDLWIEKVVKPRMRGQVYYVRYIDDFVLAFEFQDDANRFEIALGGRLSKFSLELEKSKTRMLKFGRKPFLKHPRNRLGTFDFLGFTFICQRSARAKYVVTCKTAKDRFRRAVRALKELTLAIRHLPLKEQIQRINQSLSGHYQYYGVGGNYASIHRLYRLVTRLWLRALRSRTQRHNLTWDRFNKLLSIFPLKRPLLHLPFSRFATMAIL